MSPVAPLVEEKGGRRGRMGPCFLPLVLSAPSSFLPPPCPPLLIPTLSSSSSSFPPSHPFLLTLSSSSFPPSCLLLLALSSLLSLSHPLLLALHSLPPPLPCPHCHGLSCWALSLTDVMVEDHTSPHLYWRGGAHSVVMEVVAGVAAGWGDR
ncbi:hypothetical protein BDQ12DRAFT_729854 [Crucibulum laeve]|uniref:Uncharacterized protein n=1 Tax=Crucibulum laeve TaxID=68775 RepID=A0A5C3LDL8_9AGAR|nr:hypothetical protein BDQ12DRAFT_729854 [Crucibulum laeve]